MKHFVNIILLVFYPLLVSAQYYITGTVKDEWGSPLQNVSIYVHSSGYTFYTGNDGSFGILNSRVVDTLSFTLEGYQKQKLIVAANMKEPFRMAIKSGCLSL